MLICAHSCTNLTSNLLNCTLLADYSASPFFDKRDKAKSVELSDGQWTKWQFEEAILRPLFRYAKRIHIVDRYIGRTITDTPSNLHMNNLFQDTLTWITSVFADSSRDKVDRILEITCGVLDQPDKYQIRDVAEIIVQYRDFLKQLTNTAVTFNLKLERKSKQMPHNRYLFTDQMSLAFSPGFDFLCQNNTIKAVSINPSEHRGEIEYQLRLLPNAK